MYETIIKPVQIYVIPVTAPTQRIRQTSDSGRAVKSVKSKPTRKQCKCVFFTIFTVFGIFSCFPVHGRNIQYHRYEVQFVTQKTNSLRVKIKKLQIFEGGG
ncbi:hypothetical protein GDO81_027057 [Engystomops pustulosus]|uniref:Uncharacterized protein n=1 Tax=Engystomops pustulosus TaxID=76066 RepID=A0AAV6YG02_ENGPU|nr:hypothetical protein GDO81_027057 [Engystomops pustulosus]